MKEESCIKASTCKLIAFQDKETFIEELILKFGLFVELPFANINHSNRLQPLLGIDIESLHGSNPLIFVARIHHILKLQIIILANQQLVSCFCIVNYHFAFNNYRRIIIFGSINNSTPRCNETNLLVELILHIFDDFVHLIGAVIGQFWFEIHTILIHN